MTVEEAIKIWQKTKSPYLKRDMEKFIHKHKKGAGNGKRTNLIPMSARTPEDRKRLAAIGGRACMRS